MADTERMEAVKRAYAEIILNTAAESAARILASERKAFALHRTLASTKQDALDMMLRLKSLMDSKINEAETRNLLHARRIQELESQLEKAQSVILSLQAELEREREANRNNNNKCQQSEPAAVEEEENTSSYYKNVVSTDNSSCSVKDLLSTRTSIGSEQGSKVRPRNRWTQRVRAFDQSKDPKGGQIFATKAKNKKSREIGSGREVFLRKDPPRRLRTKSNYVKISKFGMKIDGEVSQNGNKVLGKCNEMEKETIYSLDSGKGLATDEDLVGLELIADNIDKEDDKPAIEVPEVVLTGVDPKPTENKPVSKELETPVPDVIAEHNPTSVTEPEGLRSIKYTFRRKRKRAFSEINNEVTPAVIPVLEDSKDENKGSNMCNNDDNGNNGENKEGNSLEVAEERVQRLKLHQNDEGVVSDSPRSNRRLVQVARQLISLSTKKW